MKELTFLVALLISGIFSLNKATAQSAFQPYNAQGDNLIHVTTADFDGVGAKDYVVALTVSGKAIAFQRPDQISIPAADNRLWEYTELPTMAYRIIADDVLGSSTGDEVILPGTDGHLRILSSTGSLLMDLSVSTGALYTAAIGKDYTGKTIIATSGVDGLIHFLDTTGVLITTVRPKTSHANNISGVIRHLVTGDFDGNGSDEIVSFINRKSFTGNCFFDITDLSTFQRPAYYYGETSENSDNVINLGFTDKQLPHAFDMDGDGDEEVAGHWGVFHPETGPGTQVFSTMLTDNEKITLGNYNDYAKNYLIQNHGFPSNTKEKMTNTGKYLMQHGVPGDFDNDGNAELFTVYGDDLFLSDYTPSTKTLSISAYTWAHTDYHFSDVARLESRSGGADKIVLSGPINGDDHFYVVDITNTNWRTDARIIDGLGNFGEINQNLDQLTSDLDGFSGTEATVGDEPIWFINYFASFLGWEMTPANCATHAQSVYDAQQEWYDKIGGQTGYQPSRIRLAAEIASYVYGVSNDGDDPDVTAEGMVEFCRALAQKGAYFDLKIGHGSHQHMTPENLADCYEASVVNGECYMMARTRELSHYTYFDVYKPHLDSLLARAAAIGAEPPKVMLCAKGAMFSTWTQQQTDDFFPKYKDILVPGVENSNVNVQDWSIAERVGLWMNDDVKNWGCNVIGDNLTANRVAEWGGMRNAHILLRQMLNAYSLGATVFRVTSVTSKENPMYERGDVTDPNLDWTQAYKKGFINFLKIAEKGLYPNSPATEQIKGISPVSVAIYNRSDRLLEQSYKHDHHLYQPTTQDYVLNQFACWDAYTDVPDTDLSTYAWGAKRRWDNLFPSSPGGFVTIVPNRQASLLEANTWCNKAYQTNGDTWDSYSLSGAKDEISGEILAQRNNLFFHVDGECVWQVTQQKDDPLTYFLLLMGNNVLTPVERSVKLKTGIPINGIAQVYDQLSSSSEAIGALSSTTDELSITVPAGTIRILCIKLSELPDTDIGISDVENDVFKLYPNPAQYMINIELENSVNTDIPIIIYNSMGKKFKHYTLQNKKVSIDVSSWPTGMYFVKVFGVHATEKIIVK
ncbi:MAG: T9SS type A sorting domain-containing protein [Bacteroidales bacterium]|nr:T9SS type A sorting domain-containing protein [Bacteroidales bacterium]